MWSRSIFLPNLSTFYRGNMRESGLVPLGLEWTDGPTNLLSRNIPETCSIFYHIKM